MTDPDEIHDGRAEAAHGPTQPWAGEPVEVGEPVRVGESAAPMPVSRTVGALRRVSRRTVVVTAAAAVVAAGGGAIAVAAGGGGSTAAGSGAGAPVGPDGRGGPGGYGHPGGGPGEPGHQGFGPGGFGASGGGPGGLLGALHGTFTVETAARTYAQRTAQRGTVSAVGGGSLSVRSTDGYTRSYVLPSGVPGAGTVAAGDSVVVLAALAGVRATVSAVVDLQHVGVRPDMQPDMRPGARSGGPGPGGFRGLAGLAAGFGRPLHGSYVVASTAKGETTYVRDVLQSGTVSALSATSVSLRSADGVTGTYAIGPATRRSADVATGQPTLVLAGGSPVTATVLGGGGPAAGGGWSHP